MNYLTQKLTNRWIDEKEIFVKKLNLQLYIMINSYSPINGCICSRTTALDMGWNTKESKD